MLGRPEMKLARLKLEQYWRQFPKCFGHRGKEVKDSVHRLSFNMRDNPENPRTK